MSKYILSIVGIALCLSLTIGICSCSYSSNDLLTKFRNAALKSKNGDHSAVFISLSTDFEWDTLFVFGPYTPVQDIHAQLGYNWVEAEGTGIQSSETFYLLVFMKDGKVIKHCKWSRLNGDFKGLEIRNKFQRGNDAFEVIPDPTVNSDKMVLRWCPQPELGEPANTRTVP